jgi:hypothetical protein
LPDDAGGIHVPKVALDVSPELGTHAVAAKVAEAIYAQIRGPEPAFGRGGER